jgi:PST family polysaccharide transporter
MPDSDDLMIVDDVLRSADAGGKVARGSLVRGGGYVVGVGMGLATSVLLLRHLGTAEYGQYGTIAALMGLILGVTDGGMTTVGTRELSVRPAGPERENLASSLMTLRAIAATVGVLIAMAFAVAAYDPFLTLAAGLVGISVVLQSSQAMATVPLLTELRAAPIAAFDALRQVLTLAGVLILVLLGASLQPFFALQIPVTVITLAMTLVYVRRTFALGFSTHRPHLAFLIRETIPMSVAFVLNSLYLSVMVIVVSLLCNDRETGIYAAPARILEVLVFLASVMITIAIPVLAVSGGEDRPRFKNGLQLLSQATLAVAGAIAVGVIIAAPSIMVLIGGEEFAASGTVLRIQALAVIGVFANQTLQFALVTLKAQHRLIYANAIALVVLIGGGVVLVAEIGPIGGAIAVVIGEVVLAITLVVSLVKTDRSVVPSYRFAALLVISMALGISSLLLPINNWLQMLVGVAVFSGLAVVSRIVPPQALHAVLDGLQRRRNR